MRTSHPPDDPSQVAASNDKRTFRALSYGERVTRMVAKGEAPQGPRMAVTAVERGTGIPVRVVRRYAALMRAGEATNEERLTLLEAHRGTVVAKLEAIAKNLELIDCNINFYR